jgi:hypothetical protein
MNKDNLIIIVDSEEKENDKYDIELPKVEKKLSHPHEDLSTLTFVSMEIKQEIINEATKNFKEVVVMQSTVIPSPPQSIIDPKDLSTEEDEEIVVKQTNREKKMQMKSKQKQQSSPQSKPSTTTFSKLSSTVGIKSSSSTTNKNIPAKKINKELRKNLSPLSSITEETAAQSQQQQSSMNTPAEKKRSTVGITSSSSTSGTNTTTAINQNELRKNLSPPSLITKETATQSQKQQSSVNTPAVKKRSTVGITSSSSTSGTNTTTAISQNELRKNLSPPSLITKETAAQSQKQQSSVNTPAVNKRSTVEITSSSSTSSPAKRSKPNQDSFIINNPCSVIDQNDESVNFNLSILPSSIDVVLSSVIDLKTNNSSFVTSEKQRDEEDFENQPIPSSPDVVLSSVIDIKNHLIEQCVDSLSHSLSPKNADAFELSYRNLLLLEFAEFSDLYKEIDFHALLISINKFIENSLRLLKKQFLQLQDTDIVIFWALMDEVKGDDEEERKLLIDELKQKFNENYLKIKILVDESLLVDSNKKDSSDFKDLNLKLFLFKIKWKIFLTAHEKFSNKALINSVIFVYQCLPLCSSSNSSSVVQQQFLSQKKQELSTFLRSFSTKCETSHIEIPENSLKLLLVLFSAENESNNDLKTLRNRIYEYSLNSSRLKELDWSKDETRDMIDKKVNNLIRKFSSKEVIIKAEVSAIKTEKTKIIYNLINDDRKNKKKK